MRRIRTNMGARTPLVTLSERDYRLMRAVVKLATVWEFECTKFGYREASWLSLAKAVRAFNAPVKKARP